MDNVKDYVEHVKAPWGRMFYDLLFMQLNIPQSPKMQILDFGSGLGVTSNHFAAWHDVTAVEPNKEMIDNSRSDNGYTQIYGGLEKLRDFDSEVFDFIFCHNVLEYIEEKEPIIAALFRLLKPNGVLSLVKHNRAGKVFNAAVFANAPQKALELLKKNANDRSNYLGTQYIYSNEDVAVWAKRYGAIVVKILGMRAFYALGQDNDIKYEDGWYRNMLLLESRAAKVDEYKNAAFLNHLIIRKDSGRFTSMTRLS